jgi:hypothetical protein
MMVLCERAELTKHPADGYHADRREMCAVQLRFGTYLSYKVYVARMLSDRDWNPNTDFSMLFF